MSTRNLGTLVVRLALELAKYKGEWQEAEAATAQGAQNVEQAAQGAAKASDTVSDALKRQTGAFGEVAGGIAQYGQAAQAATGISTRQPAP